jgi:DNA-binding GntR family transcriptional regulator
LAVEFRLAPGERLNEVAIARRLGMSRGPVREAMNRLASEALVTPTPSQGFSMRQLSASEISALYEVRADLESAAAVAIAEEHDADHLRERLRSLLESAQEMLQARDATALETLVDRDEEFHLQIAELAGNRERVRVLQQINARIRFVRRINLEGADRAQEALQEHVAIARALARGDRADAAGLLRQHLTLSADEAVIAVRDSLARIYESRLA